MKDIENNSATSKRRLPPWEEIVELMHNEGLRFSDEYEIVDVIYSLTNEHRFVILKSCSGFLTYEYQYLVLDHEDEWEYYPQDVIPAYWYSSDWSYGDRQTKSLFNDLKDLMRDLKAEPNYKKFFEE